MCQNTFLCLNGILIEDSDLPEISYTYNVHVYLHVYVVGSTISIFFSCSEILLVRNLILDWFSYAFFIWNFGCMGLMVIHWKGPLRLQQAYLILTSALVVSLHSIV